ncbi:MAG: type II secretion system protein [Fimbriimonas sp.]
MIRRAYTLIEILVAIAIIGVMSALILSSLAQSKRSGQSASETEMMRQLGQAAAIYAENDGVRPRGTAELLATGLIGKSLCVSPLDRTPEGMANLVSETSYFGLDKATNDGRRRDYRTSYFGPWDLGYSQRYLNELTETSPNAGWLISLGSGLLPRGREIPREGQYRRLLNDGAVVVRQIRSVQTPNGGARAWQFFFADYSDEWLLDYLAHEEKYGYIGK